MRGSAQKGRIDLNQGCVDATFAPAKGGGEGVGLTRKGKGTKLQLIVDGKAFRSGTASQRRTRPSGTGCGTPPGLFSETTQPQRLIGDQACDGDKVDEMLAELRLEMIAPYRMNRRPGNVTQDGRPQRRYRSRWIAERTLAWLGARRRLFARREKRLSQYVGFTPLGCLSLQHLNPIRRRQNRPD